MSIQREVEFKFLVEGEAAFGRLAGTLGVPSPPSVRQENRFLDTPERVLEGALIAMRLRAEAGVFTLTAKGPLEESAADLAVRPEVETEVSPDEAARMRAGELGPLALFGAQRLLAPLLARIENLVGGARLADIGGFVNHRARLPLPPREALAGLVLELDQTELPGGRVDFEVECEVPLERAEVVRVALHELLRRAEVTWRPATSKLQRFAQALQSSSPGEA